MNIDNAQGCEEAPADHTQQPVPLATPAGVAGGRTRHLARFERRRSFLPQVRSRGVLPALDGGGAGLGSGPLPQSRIPVRSSPPHRHQQRAGHDTARPGTESPGQGDVRAEALRSKLAPGERAPRSRSWPSHLIVLGGVASGGATDTAVEAVACGRPTQLCASPRTQREILSRAAESSLGFALGPGGCPADRFLPRPIAGSWNFSTQSTPQGFRGPKALRYTPKPA